MAMRVLTEIPDDDLRLLDLIAAKGKRSRAATIRDAVKLFLIHNADNKDWIARGAGYWKDRTDIGDAIEYQRAMREDRRLHKDI